MPGADRRWSAGAHRGIIRGMIAASTRRQWILFATVLVGASLLRLWRITADLPDFVEEAIPFRRALDMGGWQAGPPDLHPHFFNYPSLVIYLQLALIRIQMLAGLALGQIDTAADFWLRCQYDPTGAVLTARAVSVIADLATAVGVWRLTRRHGAAPALLAVAIVAVAGPMVRTGRLIQVDPVQAALTVWAIERMTAWRLVGGNRSLAWAVVLIGLAAGAKYQGGLLVVPLAWVLWSRDGMAGLRRWPLLAAGSLAVFIVTTPYALLDFSAFWHDFRFEAGHMAGGHLGSARGGSAAFVIRSLWQGLGPVGFLAAIAGLATPLWRRRQPDPDEGTLLAAVIPLLLAVLLARVQADRYLVPLVPLLALAAAIGFAALLDLNRLHRRNGVVPLLAIAVIVPPLLATWPTLPPAGGHDQVRARRWLEARVAADDLVVSERYTGRLRALEDDQMVRAHPAWPHTSPAARRAFDDLPRFRNVVLPLVVSGNVTLTAVDLDGRRLQVEIVAHASDLNAIFYAPELLLGVTWVQVSGSIRSRHEADPGRYAAQGNWYRFLDTTGEVAAVFADGSGTAITVYRLDPDLPQLDRPLDPLWWTDPMGAGFRDAFETCCVPPDARTGGARYDAEGQLAAWVQGLRGYFEQHVAPFLVRLGHEHAGVGNVEAARHMLMPVMLAAPHLDDALALMIDVCRRQDDLLTADLLIARSLGMRRQRGDDPTFALLLQAGIRLDQGRHEEARALAEQVVQQTTAAELRDRARQVIDHLDGKRSP